jgi:hypothetical protein
MLAAVGIIFNAEVIEPRHMKILKESVVIGGTLFPLF